MFHHVGSTSMIAHKFGNLSLCHFSASLGPEKSKLESAQRLHDIHHVTAQITSTSGNMCLPSLL